MKPIRYLSATELLQRARKKMIPLPNQKDAQRSIASLIAMHLAKLQALDKGAEPEELVNCSAFLVGPTGNGKTHTIKCLAESCGLHFATIDCASITQAGVRGKNLGDNLLAIQSENASFFEGGILLLDEVDKTFYKGDGQHDAYSPMQDFLKLMEGDNYTFQSNGMAGTVNLDRTLILLAGACANIVDILKKRHNTGTVGFTASDAGPEINRSNYGAYITLDDLIAYGMMPELASRINTVIGIPEIDEAGYRQLLIDTAKTSALSRFRNQFGMRGVSLDITPGAVEQIARMCVERNVGARSINAILCERLSEAYCTVDDTYSYGKVILQTDENRRLQTVYRNEERCAQPVFLKQFSEQDVSIQEWLQNENDINFLCHDICQKASLEDIFLEPILYYFLQVSCRFLAEDVHPEDRGMISLCKLAQVTGQPFNFPSRQSPFDIICKDYLFKTEQLISQAREALNTEKGEKAPHANHAWISEMQVKHDMFRHYYLAFQNLEALQKNCPKVLTEAVGTAKDCYIAQQRNNKKGA